MLCHSTFRGCVAIVVHFKSCSQRGLCDLMLLKCLKLPCAPGTPLKAADSDSEGTTEVLSRDVLGKGVARNTHVGSDTILMSRIIPHKICTAIEQTTPIV